MSEQNREPRDPCLDAQLLAAFAEKKATRSEIGQVLAHLDGCGRCRTALETALALREPRGIQRRWLAVAAAVAIAVSAVPFARRALVSTPSEKLARLLPASSRAVEPRLSGGFAWAPYRGPMRSTDTDAEARRMKLVGVAGELVERAQSDRSAESQHAAGLGLILVEKPEEAVARLRAAAEQSPADPRAWSDLAAAEYMTALRLGRASLYPVALAHADRSLSIDPRLAEARFNRALILERLGLTAAAREAWAAYFAVDPASPWAAEARQRRQRLRDSTGDARFRRDLPRMAAAAPPDVEAFVDRFRQQSRAWAEVETLGQWAEAFEQGHVEAASRQLATARVIGAALVRLSGESLLHDAVAAIDRATQAERRSIAEGHTAYRRGRLAYSRRQPAAAEADLRRAAAAFADARDPMSLMARYYAANTRLDQNDPGDARDELETLRAEALALPRYVALAAQVRWELGLCTMLDGDWSGTALHASAAAEAFQRLGESSSLAFMQTMLATALITLGRPDEGWALRAKAFDAESSEGRGDRLLVTIGDAANVELRTGRFESAQALLAVEEAMHRTAGDDAQLSGALVRKVLIGSTLGGMGDPSRVAREAMTIARRIADPAIRARAVADATFAAGAAALGNEPHQAFALLSQGIDSYAAMGNSLYLPEARLLRARASLKLGDAGAAAHDLQAGIDEMERHVAVAGAVTGSGVLDARGALFDGLIALLLDRGDLAGAFAYAERARPRRTPSGEARPSVTALQRELAGSDTAVLELSVLPREVTAFAITADDFAVSRYPIARDDILARAARDDGETLRALYEVFIRGSEPALRKARRLIVAADPALQGVPFAALFDIRTGRYLIERMPVAVTLSASALRAAPPGRGTRSLVALALPAGEENSTVALPEKEAELAELARTYANANLIDADRASLAALAEGANGAGVIHIGGHTARQAGAGEEALLFRGRGTAADPVTWSRVASLQFGGHFDAPIVVLAACETLRAPLSRQAQGMSLGGGFLAAGASSVIGTLVPIADADARQIFLAVHQELARGSSAAAALRHAQLDAIAAEPRGHAPAWRAVAVLTNRIERL
jgi:hypothetical protein